MQARTIFRYARVFVPRHCDSIVSKTTSSLSIPCASVQNVNQVEKHKRAFRVTQHGSSSANWSDGVAPDCLSSASCMLKLRVSSPSCRARPTHALAKPLEPELHRDLCLRVACSGLNCTDYQMEQSRELHLAYMTMRFRLDEIDKTNTMSRNPHSWCLMRFESEHQVSF